MRTTIAWVVDDVPHGSTALYRLECDRVGASSFFSEHELELEETLGELFPGGKLGGTERFHSTRLSQKDAPQAWAGFPPIPAQAGVSV